MVWFLTQKSIESLLIPSFHYQYIIFITQKHHTQRQTHYPSDDSQVASVAAAAVWGFATTSDSRYKLLKLGVIPALYRNIKRSLALAVIREAEPPSPEGKHLVAD